MATLDSVKAKIQSLIAKANAKTGRADANMTNAVNALVSGYNPNGIIPSGTINITENGTVDVSTFEKAQVAVPVGSIPSGSININQNGTFNVEQYATAVVNVPVPAQTSVVRSITIASDLGNGTNTDKTILTADEFVKAHYADDGFFAMLIPTATVGTDTNVVTWLYHGNRNIGSTGCSRTGFAFFNQSATALGYRPCTAKINGSGYNVAFRAKSTGNLAMYVESGRIVKAGTYIVVLGCWS